MPDLFYTPEPEREPSEEDLLAKLKRLAGYEDLPAVSEVPKFAPGENVKMEDGFVGEIGGYVQGEPYLGLGNDGKEEWFYYVQVYDKDGPRGMEAWPEHALYRPKGYDQPGESTMEDWVGIPPAGEEYYRTAKAYNAEEALGFDPENAPDWIFPPKYVYRTMSEDHFQQSLRDGYHQSDERGNYIGQAKDDPHDWRDIMDQAVPEGTVAGYEPELGYLMNSPSGLGRCVKIEVRPEDGWQQHEQPDYLQTFQPIPTDRFVAWTWPLALKGTDTVSGEPYDRARFHPSGPPERRMAGELPQMLPFPDRAIKEFIYHHQCPACGGYLEKRGDFYTCQKCPYEYPAGGERKTARGEMTPVPEDEWNDMFQEQPAQPSGLGYPTPVTQRPFPFIYNPEGEIHWGSQGGLHREIENYLYQNGTRPQQGWMYGRYFPQGGASYQPHGDDLEIYEEGGFHLLPWSEQERIANLVRLNAPDRA